MCCVGNYEVMDSGTDELLRCSAMNRPGVSGGCVVWVRRRGCYVPPRLDRRRLRLLPAGCCRRRSGWFPSQSIGSRVDGGGLTMSGLGRVTARTCRPTRQCRPLQPTSEALHLLPAALRCSSQEGRSSGPRSGRCCRPLSRQAVQTRQGVAEQSQGFVETACAYSGTASARRWPRILTEGARTPDCTSLWNRPLIARWCPLVTLSSSLLGDRRRDALF